MTAPRFSDAEKVQALRELETAHFECGLPGSPRPEDMEQRMRRALAASNRMREILGLTTTRDPGKWTT